MKLFVFGILAGVILLGVGYTVFQAGKREVKVAETSPTVAEATGTPPVVGGDQDDNDLIKAALYKKNGWAEDLVTTVQVKTNDGKYASGLVNSDGGGGYFYAIKDSGAWKIVADGNGIIPCASLTPYPDYPATLIPSCFDEATQEIVKR